MAHLIAVDDAADPRLHEYLGLTDAALRTRREPAEGMFVAESEKVIRRAVAAGYPVRSLLTAPRWVAPLADLLDPLDVPVYVAGPEVLAAVTGFTVHRGALAVMARKPLPDPHELVRDARLVVVLEGVVDHTNVGAAFRSVAGLGADAVLVSPRCADPLYRRSVRVSMGTVLQVPWTRLAPWPAGLDDLRIAGFDVVGLALAEDALDLASYAAQAPQRVALVLGTEGDGLSHRTLARCDHTVRIPMAHGVDSLNVAAAAAVAVHALVHRG
ncbi:MAG TPA: RNA methyltransferase [Actinomycetes bacterium]|nr:RNA methyltransferase [Actinomycetes bacterium]